MTRGTATWILVGAICVGSWARADDFFGDPLDGEAFGRDVPSFAAEEFVQAGGVDIGVPGYSVPSFVDWNNDGLRDLVVGQGSSSATATVRIYLNVGTAAAPEFADYLIAQSDGADLVVPGSGCLGTFPRVVYWDADDRKDLLIGQADGRVELFLNVNTDADPSFDGGTYLQVGEPGFKTDLDVGYRATSSTADWDNDGRKDLIVGAYDGKIHVFLNEGSDGAPDFRAESFAQDDGADLLVPSNRSSPVVFDLDGDGAKDLVVGNTEGQMLFYRNVGTDAAPAFSGYSPIEADGAPIDLAGTPRSRPSVCYWTDDGYPDLLIGAGDGLVHLCRGIPMVGDVNCDGLINAFDIDPFVQALTGPEDFAGASPDCEYMLADINGDGLVNAFDIDPFVALLTGG